MIINCTNCNKKFNVDEKLIPENGRLLQCSSCNHKWHHIIQRKEKKILKNVNLSNNIINKSSNSDNKISISPSLAEKNSNQKENKNNNKTKSLDTKKKYKNKNISLANIPGNLIIIFITFIALILILDTFKNNISNFLPVLIPFLDNLYLSIYDLFSFVKDLFN